MSYGVALRNGIPFTLGTIAALCVNATGQAWSPAALWPTGTEPGMWIDPSNLTSQWQDSTGTTPVSTPGTVADSSNPVGLALDLRLGATVLTDPGNHLLQATSTARPLESARRNLMTYTEDFSNAVWIPVDVTITSNVTSDPMGTSTADLAVPTAVSGNHRVRQNSTTAMAGASACSFYVKAAGYSKVGIREDQSTGALAAFDLSSGGSVIATHGAAVSDPTIVSVGDGFYRITATFSGVDPIRVALCVLPPSYTSGAAPNWSGDGVSGVYIWGAQLEYGPVATDYQAILTDGSTYSPTGFPYYQKYDGTDDGMATATFAAGTLTSDMDCMIAVRRDSGANAVCGLYESVSDANKVFGIAENGSGSGCVGSGAGTPTVWVDGAQLTGGTAVTRGTLHTALSVGDWHILELRGLDLSTWTAVGRGLYTGALLNGAFGGILLFPSSTSTANRDAARTWLGAKVGLTL